MKLQEVTRTTLVQRGHEERGGGRLALARQVRARGQSLLRGQQQPHQLLHNLRAQIQHGKYSLPILYPSDVHISTYVNIVNVPDPAPRLGPLQVPGGLLEGRHEELQDLPAPGGAGRQCAHLRRRRHGGGQRAAAPRRVTQCAVRMRR